MKDDDRAQPIDFEKWGMSEGQRLMLEFCESVEAGEAPSREALQFFCERFRRVLWTVDRYPKRKAIAKGLLGLDSAAGRKDTAEAQSEQFENAMFIVSRMDQGMEEKEAVKERWRMLIRNEKPVTEKTLQNHYRKHGAAARSVCSMLRHAARWDAARAFRLEADGRTLVLCKQCFKDEKLPVRIISEFLDEPACDNPACPEKN